MICKSSWCKNHFEKKGFLWNTPSVSWGITLASVSTFHQETRKQSTLPKRYRLSNSISDSRYFIGLWEMFAWPGWSEYGERWTPTAVPREIHIKWTLRLIICNIRTEVVVIMSYACVVNLWLVCVCINYSGTLCGPLSDDPTPKDLQIQSSEYISSFLKWLSYLFF